MIRDEIPAIRMDCQSSCRRMCHLIFKATRSITSIDIWMMIYFPWCQQLTRSLFSIPILWHAISNQCTAVYIMEGNLIFLEFDVISMFFFRLISSVWYIGFIRVISFLLRQSSMMNVFAIKPCTKIRHSTSFFFFVLWFWLYRSHDALSTRMNQLIVDDFCLTLWC